MLENTIRNFFVLITAFYIYYKLLNTKPQCTRMQLITFPLCLLASICTAFLFHGIKSLNWLCLVLVLFLIIMYIQKSNLTIIYMTTLLAFTFSFIMLCLSTILSSFIFAPFYYQKYEIPRFLLRTVIGIFQLLLTYFGFRIPRIRKGMIFLSSIPSVNAGSTLCALLIMLLIMFYQTKSTTDFYDHLFPY